MPSPFGIMPSNTHSATLRTRGANNTTKNAASQKTTATTAMSGLTARPSLERNQHHVLSWPPTQVRLRPTMMGPDDDDSDVPILEREQDFGLYLDEDPLTYFLTPAPELDGDGDLAMMDFDAGIGASNLAGDDGVRSVSPSSLDGGSIRGKFAGPFRPPTPPRSPPGTPLMFDNTTDEDDDDDDENEDYIRLGPNHGLPSPLLTLRDFASLKTRKRHHSAPSLDAIRIKPRPSSPLLSLPLSPPATPSSPSSSPRGRAPGRFGPGRGAATGSLVAAAPPPARRRLSPRSWRQPSPDVWSIEEEPEREERCEAAAAASTLVSDKSAKPKKRVRFVLPVEEE